MAVTAICGDVRITVVRCSQLALDAQRRWGWQDPQLAAQWGAHAAYTNMYSTLLQPGERIKATLQQPGRDLFAEAISVGEVRGFVTTEGPAGDAVAVAGGSEQPLLLSLDRIRYGAREAHTTAVPACNDMRSTWQRIFDDSEQISTFTCVEMSGEGDRCPTEGGLFIGGLQIQALPPADAATNANAVNFGAEIVDAKRQAWKSNELPRMSSLMGVGQDSPEEYLRAITASSFDRIGLRFGSSRSESLGGMSGTVAAIQYVADLQVRPLDFHCRCSKDGFVQRLSVLDTSELREVSALAIPHQSSNATIQVHRLPDDRQRGQQTKSIMDGRL